MNDKFFNASWLKSLIYNPKFSITPSISVIGNSMKPVLKNKDVLILTEKNQYILGDIVVFQYKSMEYIVHRIVSCSGEQIVCKGDNSFRLEYIKSNDIIGSVKSVIRDGRRYIIRSIPEPMLELSYQIGEMAETSGYDIRKVVLSDIYKEYYRKYLDGKKDWLEHEE